MPSTDRRSPARWLGPLALLAAVVAVVAVVGGGSGSGGGRGGQGERTSPRPATTTVSTTKTRRLPSRYVIKSGDVLSVIADRYGISAARLQELNPTVDPRALRPGTELRLR